MAVGEVNGMETGAFMNRSGSVLAGILAPSFEFPLSSHWSLFQNHTEPVSSVAGRLFTAGGSRGVCSSSAPTSGWAERPCRQELSTVFARRDVC